jgi:hypothetical protein
VFADQTKVADVNQRIERKAQHKNEVLTVDRVTQQNHTAHQRYVPECDWHVRALLVFTDYPLQYESGAEYHLARETYYEPERVAGHLFHYGTFEKLNYRLQHNFAPVFNQINGYIINQFLVKLKDWVDK